MSINSVVRTVVSRGKSEYEEEIVKWYLNEHFPLLLNFSGLFETALYKQLGDNEKSFTLVASYTFADEKTLNEYKNSSILIEAYEDSRKRWKNNEFEVIYRQEMKLL